MGQHRVPKPLGQPPRPCYGCVEAFWVRTRPMRWLIAGLRGHRDVL